MIVPALKINFLIAWTFAFVKSDLCPQLYKRYSILHTACLPPNSSCKILKTGVSTKDVQVILREHNLLRSIVATGKETTGPLPPAANMLQLVWHDELAEVAQKHANQCKMEHDCNLCRKIRDFNVGQNLYEYLTTSTQSMKPNWTAAIHEWYNEVKYFDLKVLQNFDTSKHEEYGHFTQLIWASTERIGCGYTLFEDGKYQHELYTCNYGPDGNILHESVYETGVPCSSCPDHFACNNEFVNIRRKPQFPGLCKYSDQKVLGVLKNDYLLYCDFQDASSCRIETNGEWKVTHTLSGSYIGIVLQGGESSVVNFTQAFKAKNEMCLSLYYRKGPNEDGKEAANTAYEHLHNLITGEEVKIRLPDNPNIFAKFDLSFKSSYETKLSLSFSIPLNKPKQYFEFKNVQAKEGSC